MISFQKTVSQSLCARACAHLVVLRHSAATVPFDLCMKIALALQVSGGGGAQEQASVAPAGQSDMTTHAASSGQPAYHLAALVAASSSKPCKQAHSFRSGVMRVPECQRVDLQCWRGTDAVSRRFDSLTV